MEVITEPYRVCFKVLNFYGFYLPKDVKIRWKIYGVAMFCVIHLHFVVVSIFNMVKVQKLDELLLPMLHVKFSICLVAMIICFKCNESKIIEITEEFEALNHELDKTMLDRKFTFIRRFISMLISTDVAVGVVLAFVVAIFCKAKMFLLPMFYVSDYDLVHYLLYAIHCPMVYIIGTSVTTLESLFTISLLVLRIHLEELKRKIENQDLVDKKVMKNVVGYHLQLLG
jgi:hypothetical protein